ncbi:5'-methylthioadenosine/S-adenosylhomocysteine nucleosidase [Candidatus Gracilibacteria bacterium]|nr:5'-methylthioadenosine/S-adenosylhomocysteine nucleosidase [Candidatus Gracilibacteria bacterium]
MQLTKVIITAMQEEADLIIKRFGLKEVDKKKNITIFEGERVSDDGNDKIILVLSGIGKIQATIAMTHILENYQVDKIVNIGIAGNLNNTDSKIGDVFLPNSFIQHDIYLPFDGNHLDYAKKAIFLDYAVGENYNLEKFGLVLNGVCLTGDQFIDNEDKVKQLRKEYSADICEMEAFAILSVAREYDVLDKCVVIKAISDGADSYAKTEHMDNLEFAMNNSVDVLELVL